MRRLRKSVGSVNIIFLFALLAPRPGAGPCAMMDWVSRPRAVSSPAAPTIISLERPSSPNRGIMIGPGSQSGDRIASTITRPPLSIAHFLQSLLHAIDILLLQAFTDLDLQPFAYLGLQSLGDLDLQSLADLDLLLVEALGELLLQPPRDLSFQSCPGLFLPEFPLKVFTEISPKTTVTVPSMQSDKIPRSIGSRLLHCLILRWEAVGHRSGG